MEKKNYGVMRILEGMKYSPVGKHSAVQVCRWCRNSLNGRGVCWKEKFYGIESHRCCEFSPAVMWCENKCLHCWRPIEMNLGDCISKNEKEIDDPKEILEKIVEARKKLLMGFKGNKNVDKKKFKESLEPTLFTMSLSGEPTIYPKLSGLIKEIRKRKAVSFLVTNGQNPEAIKKLEKENALPTQLTVSMNAPNERLFKIWHRSTKKDSWERFNETLDLMKKLKGRVRRALRMTLVKKGKDKKKLFNDISNMEDENVIEYVRLIKKSQPDFVHVKGFMSVGYARDRMGYDKMPWHKEVKEFAIKLVDELKKDKETADYKILDEEERSCVVVLGKNKKDMKIDWENV